MRHSSIPDMYDVYALALRNVEDRAREAYENGLAQSIGALSFVRDFGTLQMDLGRRSGKSMFIKRNCRERDLIIVPTQREVTNYKMLWAGAKVISVAEAEGVLGADYRNYRYVWIDEPLMCAAASTKCYRHFIKDAKFKADSICVMLGQLA